MSTRDNNEVKAATLARVWRAQIPAWDTESQTWVSPLYAIYYRILGTALHDLCHSHSNSAEKRNLAKDALEFFGDRKRLGPYADVLDLNVTWLQMGAETLHRISLETPPKTRKKKKGKT